jgi:hypothetical protein
MLKINMIMLFECSYIFHNYLIINTNVNYVNYSSRKVQRKV